MDRPGWSAWSEVFKGSDAAGEPRLQKHTPRFRHRRKLMTLRNSHQLGDENWAFCCKVSLLFGQVQCLDKRDGGLTSTSVDGALRV